MRIFADESIAVPNDNSVSVLTATKYDNVGGARATLARIALISGSNGVVVHYRLTGDDPTSTASFPLKVGDAPIEITGYENLVNLRFSSLSSGSGELFVSYGN